jgi:hypothetical protein
MVVQYPHVLSFEKVSATPIEEDENGDIIVPPPGVITTIGIACRFEPNAKGETIITNDGTALTYNWNVYAPLDQPDVPEGAEISGFGGGKQIASGVVKRFYRGQLNITIII